MVICSLSIMLLCGRGWNDLCTCWYDSILLAGNVVLTSTVEENGRRFACEGEMVTFTCQVFRSVFLKWNSPLIHQTPIVFVSGFTALVSTSRTPFIATLTSIAGIGLNTNFTSTLQVNASRTFAKNQTAVQCRNHRRVTEESKFTVAGSCYYIELPVFSLTSLG